MIKKKNYLLFFSFFVFITSCSLDNKTGIWDGAEEQKKRIDKLREERKRIVSTISLYSTKDFESKEIPPKTTITLSSPKILIR